MKKLSLLLIIFLSLTSFSKAQWVTNIYGTYYSGHVSVNTPTPNSPMEFTVYGQQILYGPQASLMFGGVDNTEFGWGQYGIEYNVESGGLNFWKPWGSNNYKNWILFLKDDGRVGIGTNILSTDYMLTVAGGINARKVLITETAGGADFVFEKNYNLKTIGLLESYIQKNKHLPDIPSAKEMATNGINVNEFQIKLLQKVEELTLYIIQQDKEIKSLKARLDMKK